MTYNSEAKIKTAERLKQLRESRGFSHDRLALALHEKYGNDEEKPIISSGVLKNYEVIDKYHTKFVAGFGMNITYLVMFADFYGVSTDYLLGVTEVKTPDVKIQAAVEMLGLSEEAIDVISNFDPEKQKILSTIIENDKLGEILFGIDDVVNQKSLYYQYILDISERINKADKSAMANISSPLAGLGGAYLDALNRIKATDSKSISAKKYIEVLRYSLKNIFEDIINEVTYSKDFDTGIIDGFTQLIRTDDDDLLYKSRTDLLKMVQNDHWRGFLLKNPGWSKE